MKFKLLTLASLLCFSCLIFSCKKDDASVEESPFFDFFNEPSITIDTVGQAADTWEYGFTFTPLNSGKITQLGIKLPAVGNFTVTLWDLSGATPVALSTKTANSATVHANAFTDIPEVSVEKDTKLGITVLSNAFYRMTKTGSGRFDFPKTTGNIRIDSFNEAINNTNTATFPPNTNDTRIAPCVNIIFIAD